MALAKINRLISIFDESLHALSSGATMADAERLAMLVHHSMDSKTRAYHSTDHVIDLCVGMNPHQRLAALFHDIVYYQLDGGFAKHIVGLLQDVVRVEGANVIVRNPVNKDANVALCLSVFGFTPGQTLPLYGGMNEFLSAVVAARSLRDRVKHHDLVAVLACIEATIPFRGLNAEGLTAAQVLANRVEKETSKAFATKAVQDAVALANQDVSSFCQADPGLFLSNTWLLIEESNAPLQAVGLYSLQEYRSALVRMWTFLAHLDSSTIFQSHEAVPDAQTLENMGLVAKANIAFACDFLDAKITSIGIIEALALCSGGDCPVSMLLGDVYSRSGRPHRVEDYLPQAPKDRGLNPKLLNVLSAGRARESRNDMTQSPLTAFIYQHLGHVGTQSVCVQLKQMFAKQLAPQAFLQGLDRALLVPIIQACTRIAISRKSALQRLEAALT